MFMGFNSAVRGLVASQRSLYTTNHNISNTNTPGYSRQEVRQVATDPYRMPGIGFMGTGTEITDINRIRDSFTDYKYWNQMAPLGEWEAKNEVLVELEKLMGEPSNSSFRQYMDDFYQSIENLSTNPGDKAYREPVRENAMAFTKHLNETTKRLGKLKEDVKYNLETKINQINSLSKQVASLNKQIYTQELDGRSANDLRDKRELLVDQMSSLANISVSESKGKYDISISGISLVDHLNTNEIRLKEEDGILEAIWENGGSVRLQGGEIKGLLEVYQGDGRNGSYRGINFFMDQLNFFAKGFADKFNQAHKNGKIGENQDPGDFFTYDPNNPGASISLHEDIVASVDNIAVGKTPNPEDNENLLEILDLLNSKTFFNEDKMPKGSPEDFIKSIVSSLAVDSMQADRILETQKLIENNLRSRRMSISGVNLDDEMADLVRFQHVYVASAKMVSTLDSIIDVTVNRLGLVGR